MSNARLAVTVSGLDDQGLAERARVCALEWGLKFVPRPPKAALDTLFDDEIEAFLVLGGDGWTLRDHQGALRYSPNMAQLRIKRIDSGIHDDVLVRLSELAPGDSVLDCTLGLGADALVCARVVGPTGRVVGVEKILPLWVLAFHGLRDWPADRFARIEVERGDAVDYLRSRPSGSFDCVLFDPMFDKPKRASPPFEVLRRFALDAPLTEEMLEEGRRVARRWVVVKSARYTPALKRLGLMPEPISRHSPVVWARVRAKA